jgi:hypothetical protein
MKGVDNMKNFVKFAVVGLAGYLIGFYEMKYKTMKTLLQVNIDKKSESTDKKEGES